MAEPTPDLDLSSLQRKLTVRMLPDGPLLELPDIAPTLLFAIQKWHTRTVAGDETADADVDELVGKALRVPPAEAAGFSGMSKAALLTFLAGAPVRLLTMRS